MTCRSLPTGSTKTDELYQFAKEADEDRDALLAYVDELVTLRAGTLELLSQHIHTLNRAEATVTELSHHGDMTPAAKRVLMNVLDGVE